jgi:mannose-6-phosphate isomerase-like protein (cupin superfamily)
VPIERIDPARYDTRLDVKYPHHAVIDLRAEVAAHRPWFNQTLTRVNDVVVRVGLVEGEYHWHKHDDEDEFFLVLEGELHIDIEGQPSVVLSPQQGYTVSRGIVHRTRAPRRTVILMVEAASIAPTGDGAA